MNASAVPTIDVEAAAAATDVVLLDIREHDEWIRGRAAAAVHIPMSQLTSRVGELDHAAHIVCVCRSGNRATSVTQWLIQQGFEAKNMKGGMLAWEAAGYPIVNQAGNPGLVI
ncbi:MAG: rhodanese-like domain-containing protein [Actinomycetota bacterium]|nr:rhodanese-like domain-containing protein [Actinomycetota bacterium]